MINMTKKISIEHRNDNVPTNMNDKILTPRILEILLMFWKHVIIPGKNDFHMFKNLLTYVYFAPYNFSKVAIARRNKN